MLECLARLFNNYFNPCIPVSRSHIATAPGAAGCLDALLYNICNAGDGVLIPGPQWGKLYGPDTRETGNGPMLTRTFLA